MWKFWLNWEYRKSALPRKIYWSLYFFGWLKVCMERRLCAYLAYLRYDELWAGPIPGVTVPTPDQVRSAEAFQQQILLKEQQLREQKQQQKRLQQEQKQQEQQQKQQSKAGSSTATPAGQAAVRRQMRQSQPARPPPQAHAARHTQQPRLHRQSSGGASSSSAAMGGVSSSREGKHRPSQRSPGSRSSTRRASNQIRPQKSRTSVSGPSGANRSSEEATKAWEAMSQEHLSALMALLPPSADNPR
mmetsp:Transcript_71423/g.149242  ORF Transcript_71423/g.149242 Transcript_71423/m.149242 type:complete len:245 (-) Transcript_71423:18-752(-)